MSEQLVNRIYSMLHRSYEEKLGQGIRKPKFKVVLSPSELREIRLYVVGLPVAQRTFIGLEFNNTIFGCEIEEETTPRIEFIGD